MSNVVSLNREQDDLFVAARLLDLPVEATPLHGVIVLAYKTEDDILFGIASLGSALMSDRIGLLHLGAYELAAETQGLL